MKVKFWGVRGSIPVPGPGTARYGGNTACVEISGANGECIILDAGSGIRMLGMDLVKRGPLPLIHILISHTHWDHIQGFPFFAPCYIPGTGIQVKGPVHDPENTPIRDVFDIQMQYEFFPVSNQQLDAEIHYETLAETTLAIGGIQIRTQLVNHPVRCFSYRLTENGRSVVYATDHEPYDHEPYDHKPFYDSSETGKTAETRDADLRFVDFVRGADLFISDSQYTPDEYPSKKRNWGHSSWDHCLQWMKAAGAKQMALTHHDPLRTDDQLEAILKNVRRAAAEKGIDPNTVITAQEGIEITV